MSKIINNITALDDIADLTTPTSSQKYELGTEIEIKDTDTTTVSTFKYVKAHAALTAYTPYAIIPSGTAAGEVVTAAPVATASAIVEVGVPQVAFTSDYYGFVQTKGEATAVIAATTTYVDGNAMEVIGAGTSFIAASTALIPTINTSAFLVTNTTGTSGTVILPGYRVEVTT